MQNANPLKVKRKYKFCTDNKNVFEKLLIDVPVLFTSNKLYLMTDWESKTKNNFINEKCAIENFIIYLWKNCIFFIFFASLISGQRQAIIQEHEALIWR